MTQSDETRLPARVVGCLQDGFITVLLGVGIGHMDGGFHHPIPVADIPIELRTPNAEFEVILQLSPWKILRIEPKTDESGKT